MLLLVGQYWGLDEGFAGKVLCLIDGLVSNPAVRTPLSPVIFFDVLFLLQPVRWETIPPEKHPPIDGSIPTN